MVMTGMDIIEVRSLAQQLNNASQEIQQLAQQLTTRLQNTPWVGADRERFVSDWEGQHRQGLQQVVSALQHAAQLATQNASEQENVSNA